MAAKAKGKSQDDTIGNHIARRKEQSGQSYRQVAKEFGVSHSKAHRLVKKAAGDYTRHGFTRIGTAKD